MKADEPNWMHLVTLSNGLDADRATLLLEGSNIPVLVNRGDTGILGPGFAGYSVAGVMLSVPAEFVSKAQEIIADFL